MNAPITGGCSGTGDVPFALAGPRASGWLHMKHLRMYVIVPRVGSHPPISGNFRSKIQGRCRCQYPVPSPHASNTIPSHPIPSDPDFSIPSYTSPSCPFQQINRFHHPRLDTPPRCKTFLFAMWERPAADDFTPSQDPDRAQGIGKCPASTSDSDYDYSPAQVMMVRESLLSSTRLPLELIDLILDAAQVWACTYARRDFLDLENGCMSVKGGKPATENFFCVTPHPPSRLH